MPLAPRDALAWLAVAGFVAAVLVERRDRRLGRALGALSWAVFAAFWLLLVPYFAFVHMSIIEGVLSAIAVPACLYVGYRLWRGRDSLFVVTRAIAVMGVVYLPFTTFPWLARPLIDVTARQTEFVFGALGYDPGVTGENGLANTFVFETDGHIYRTTIVLACTGLGSMTIFVGLVAAVTAPLRRKARALAIALPVIWALNLGRNVFIALAQGNQWFADIYPDVVMFAFGTSDPHLVSFLWADRVVSQSLSVVALVAITWLVVRQLPELSIVFEELIYLATGREMDLRGVVGRDVGTDGGSRP